MISRFELITIRRMREKVTALRVQADALAETLRQREENVIERMEAGVPVDGVAVVMTRRRQNISWLTVVKRELGEKAIIQAKDEWPVVFYKELQID
jgi:hypothetical protein